MVVDHVRKTFKAEFGKEPPPRSIQQEAWIRAAICDFIQSKVPTQYCPGTWDELTGQEQKAETDYQREVEEETRLALGLSNGAKTHPRESFPILPIALMGGVGILGLFLFLKIK